MGCVSTSRKRASKKCHDYTFSWSFRSRSSPEMRQSVASTQVLQMLCLLGNSKSIGVLAFSIFGPGWLARSSGLAAAIAFMIYTCFVHPPAASLPLLFIDGAKLHHLNFWYALFPSAAGCIVLCLIVLSTFGVCVIDFSGCFARDPSVMHRVGDVLL